MLGGEVDEIGDGGMAEIAGSWRLGEEGMAAEGEDGIKWEEGSEELEKEGGWDWTGEEEQSESEDMEAGINCFLERMNSGK